MSQRSVFVLFKTSLNWLASFNGRFDVRSFCVRVRFLELMASCGRFSNKYIAIRCGISGQRRPFWTSLSYRRQTDRTARCAVWRPSCCTQMWTLSAINWRLSWQHLRRSTCCGKNFSSPEFETKFRREVPLFWRYPNSLPTHCIG